MIATIGLDLAKNVFQVHGVDARGNVRMKKTLRRAQVASFFSQLAPCIVGMEACGGAHFWARKLQAFGHTVRLMAPQFVKPYVKSQKNDAADAEAICEAVGRPSMRFVPIKTVEQQAVLAVHRVRQGLVKLRTAQVNQLRCLLAEYGLVLPRGIQHMRGVPALLDGAVNELPQTFVQLMLQQLESIRALDRRIAALEGDIRRWHRESAASRRLAEVPGIGPLTASTRRHDRQRSNVRERPSARGMDRPCAAPALQRREAEAARYRQAGRRLLAQPARAWRAFGGRLAAASEQRYLALAGPAAAATTHQHRDRCASQ